jgi:hypothetical protein
MEVVEEVILQAKVSVEVVMVLLLQTETHLPHEQIVVVEVVVLIPQQLQVQ